VNGYYSSRPVSPAKGYVRLRGTDGTNYGSHRGSQFAKDRGVIINISETMENIKRDWATQLSIYSWLTGEPVGGDFIVAVDQVLCQNDARQSGGGRIAEHRAKIGVWFQKEIFSALCEAWECVTAFYSGGAFFPELGVEGSISRCAVLDGVYAQGSDLSWLEELRRD
jgi:hypothetical protein